MPRIVVTNSWAAGVGERKTLKATKYLSGKEHHGRYLHWYGPGNEEQKDDTSFEGN